MEYNGFSIITVTNRKYCIDNLINNYTQQTVNNKELIIIINNNEIKVEDFYEYYPKIPNVFIYKLNEEISLGKCLNYAINKCQFGYISKFDDDDYYGPFYLSEMKNTFESIDCDIIGKYKTFYYIEKYNKLILKNSSMQNKYTSSIMGSTITFKKNIFENIKFRDVSKREDFYFNKDCYRYGYKIYANSCYNHIVFKHEDNKKHTFTSDISILMNKCSDVKLNTSLEDCYEFVDKFI